VLPAPPFYQLCIERPNCFTPVQGVHPLVLRHSDPALTNFGATAQTEVYYSLDSYKLDDSQQRGRYFDAIATSGAYHEATGSGILSASVAYQQRDHSGASLL
jgi:hypothetical protein